MFERDEIYQSASEHRFKSDGWLIGHVIFRHFFNSTSPLSLNCIDILSRNFFSYTVLLNSTPVQTRMVHYKGTKMKRTNITITLDFSLRSHIRLTSFTKKSKGGKSTVLTKTRLLHQIVNLEDFVDERSWEGIWTTRSTRSLTQDSWKWNIFFRSISCEYGYGLIFGDETLFLH